MMLKVTNLSKRVGNKEILSNLNLSVAPGERVAITGPSGVGKSTLLRCIAGLDSFDGDVVCKGKRVLVFQDFNLFPHLTVFENLVYVPLSVLGVAREDATLQAEALLEAFLISSYKHSYPRDLSGGQQQRVSLARALMTKPELILMDEPTSALDQNTTVLVANFLKTFPTTFLFVTHDLFFVQNFATKVMQFDNNGVLS